VLGFFSCWELSISYGTKSEAGLKGGRGVSVLKRRVAVANASYAGSSRALNLEDLYRWKLSSLHRHIKLIRFLFCKTLGVSYRRENEANSSWGVLAST
jgi:hypothetical protein